MKTPFSHFTFLLAGAAALSLAVTPVIAADPTQPETSTQNSKSGDSTAENHKATTGAPASQQATLDRTNSKDNTQSLDKNPGRQDTASADKAATKDPNSATSPATQNSPPSSPKLAHKERTSDKSFLTHAAEGGMAEVEMGKLAQEKGSSAEVKNFGSHMVNDHSQVNSELQSLAQQKGVAVPDKLDAKHQASIDSMKALNGPAFDKAFVNTMVKDHEKDAAEFREASASAQDPQVKSFADKNLKMIESHLADIKNIQQNLK